MSPPSPEPVPMSVLIADDHPAVRDGIRLRLELDDRLSVVGDAADGREALELIREHRPQVVIADLRMPVLDGLQLLHAVNDESLPTRVILLSAHTEAHLVQQALDLGAFGYIGKDSALEMVVDAVCAVAIGNRYIDPTLLAGLLETSEQRLTAREREVLQLAANGMQNKVIAIELKVGEETIKSHVSNVMRKLNANSRTQAVASALRQSLIE